MGIDVNGAGNMEYTCIVDAISGYAKEYQLSDGPHNIPLRKKEGDPEDKTLRGVAEAIARRLTRDKAGIVLRVGRGSIPRSTNYCGPELRVSSKERLAMEIVNPSSENDEFFELAEEIKSALAGK